MLDETGHVILEQCVAEHKVAGNDNRRACVAVAQYVFIVVAIEGITETACIREQLEEAIERLKVVAAQDGGIAHPVLVICFPGRHHLALLHYFVWHLVHNGEEGKDEGVLVVVAYRGVEHYVEKSVFASRLLDGFGNVGIIVAERHEPVGYLAEEGEVLHAAESLIEEIHTLVALVNKTAHLLL